MADAKKAAKKNRTDANTSQSSLLRYGKHIQLTVENNRVVSKTITHSNPNAEPKTGTVGVHTCDLCGKAFNRSCELSNHRKTHDTSVVNSLPIADAMPADVTSNDYAAIVLAGEEEYESNEDDSYADSNADDEDMPSLYSKCSSDDDMDTDDDDNLIPSIDTKVFFARSDRADAGVAPMDTSDDDVEDIGSDDEDEGGNEETAAATEGPRRRGGVRTNDEVSSNHVVDESDDDDASPIASGTNTNIKKTRQSYDNCFKVSIVQEFEQLREKYGMTKPSTCPKKLLKIC